MNCAAQNCPNPAVRGASFCSEEHYEDLVAERQRNRQCSLPSGFKPVPPAMKRATTGVPFKKKEPAKTMPAIAEEQQLKPDMQVSAESCAEQPKGAVEVAPVGNESATSRRGDMGANPVAPRKAPVEQARVPGKPGRAGHAVDHGRIRRCYKDGAKIKQLAREFHIGVARVRKIVGLDQEEKKVNANMQAKESAPVVTVFTEPKQQDGPVVEAVEATEKESVQSLRHFTQGFQGSVYDSLPGAISREPFTPKALSPVDTVLCDLYQERDKLNGVIAFLEKRRNA